MLEKLLSFGLACLLIFISANTRPVFAQQTANQQPDTANALKACVLHKIAGRGDMHIEVTLRNGQKLKGTIGQAEEDYFTIHYHGNRTLVPYSEVVSFKCGKIFNAGREVGRLAIGLAIGLGVALLLAVVLLQGDN